MKLITVFFFILVFYGSSTIAQTQTTHETEIQAEMEIFARQFSLGSEGGGGGDTGELKVSEIRDDILKWILDKGSRNLNLPSGLSHLEYEARMRYVLKDGLVNIIFVEKDHPTNKELQVQINGKPKTCRGFFSENDKKPNIICNMKRFDSSKPKQQYKLIHHEYASLASLEKNKGEQSDYRISNQLPQFLSFEDSLKLKVRKRVSKKDNYIKNIDGSYTVINPKLVRGNKSFAFGYDYIYADFEGVCDAMGFDALLPHSVYKGKYSRETRVYVNMYGDLRRTEKREVGHSVQSISCLNSNEYIATVEFERFIENEDNSVTIINPKLIRGNKSYPFDAVSSSTGICKLIGFKEYLIYSAGSGIYERNDFAVVDENGNLEHIDRNEKGHRVSEITCHGGDHVTMVIDQFGKRYFQKAN